MMVQSVLLLLFFVLLLFFQHRRRNRRQRNVSHSNETFKSLTPQRENRADFEEIRASGGCEWKLTSLTSKEVSMMDSPCDVHYGAVCI
jgi:hypothetical protein